MAMLSIVTATYNSEDTILSSIESLNQQTFSDVEHIVIDGGSTDSTVDIIKQKSKYLSRLVREKDEGIYYALNKGIQLSQGEYVGFLHSDDLFDNQNTLRRIVDSLTGNNLDILYGDLKYVSKEDTSKTIRYWRSATFNPRLLSKGWMPPHPTFYMRTSLYRTMGVFNTKYKISADYDAILRYLSSDGLNIGYLSEVVIKMRMGGKSNKSLTNIFSKMAEDYKILETHGLPGLSTLLMKNISKIPQFF